MKETINPVFHSELGLTASFSKTYFQNNNKAIVPVHVDFIKKNIDKTNVPNSRQNRIHIPSRRTQRFTMDLRYP